MEYNIPKSVRQLTELKMYAELIGNYKKYGIKSLYDNTTEDCDGYWPYQNDGRHGGAARYQ